MTASERSPQGSPCLFTHRLPHLARTCTHPKDVVCCSPVRQAQELDMSWPKGSGKACRALGLQESMQVGTQTVQLHQLRQAACTALSKACAHC